MQDIYYVMQSSIVLYTLEFKYNYPKHNIRRP